MSLNRRTLTTLAATPVAAVLLMGSMTWGGNNWITTFETSDNGTVTYIDAHVTDVVSHPCNGDDPIFETLDETVELVAGFTLTPTASGTFCRVDLLLDGYPQVGGVINGHSVVENPAIDKLIFESTAGAPEDTKFYAGEFGVVTVSLTEL